MKSQDIRQSFLDYFADRDHRVTPSAPLVPHGDATLMFTNAGMVQFKDFFLGLEKPPQPRAVSSQKCLRVSGKHNDLENVGPSPRHHTFFEMLGNFSFGDYFKEDAIKFGWELVTEGWGLPKENLFATVFEEDDEAEALWRKISGLPADRILRCGAKDNFWAMGDTGPCGPCSEIFVDMYPDQPHVPWEEGSDNGRYLEIWNLVFMQFERNEAGELKELPNPSIDTGAGLERVAAVLQGKKSNYDSDLFQPILEAAADLAGTAYGRDAGADTSLRVIADHLRAGAFLLADGVIPAPDGRGYVLRRLLRRAVRHGMRLGFEEPFLHRLIGSVEGVLGGHFEELGKTRQATEATVQEEEEKYLQTRAAGGRRIQEAVDRTRGAGLTSLPGQEIFDLYQTYGQELDTVREVAEEERLELDVEGFEKLLAKTREESRKVTGELQKRMASLRQALALETLGDGAETQFLGYDANSLEGLEVLRIAATSAEGAKAVEALGVGKTGVVVTPQTVFYAESGGQVGDQGTITWSHDGEEGLARVFDTQKDTSGTFFHFVEVERGSLAAGMHADLKVDAGRRTATERHHTATHLLHAALHAVLGDGARQAGSLVAPDRLRFDFTYNKPVTTEEIRQIEDHVNTWIRKSVPTDIRLQTKEEALERGAMALFGEKYGDDVRTVEIPGFSLELCGGCHVRSTGEIGLVLVTGERGVASGVRRIEAVTGETALSLVRERDALVEEVAARLGVPADRAPIEAGALKQKVKDLEKELAQMRMQLVAGAASESSGEQEVEGVKLIAREVPTAPRGELRNMADTLRDQLGSGVVVLVAPDDEKVALLVTVSKDLIGRVKAGQLIKPLAEIVGGSGGGRPDFAQAGGKDVSKLGELIAAVPDALRQQLA